MKIKLGGGENDLKAPPKAAQVAPSPPSTPTPSSGPSSPRRRCCARWGCCDYVLVVLMVLVALLAAMSVTYKFVGRHHGKGEHRGPRAARCRVFDVRAHGELACPTCRGRHRGADRQSHGWWDYMKPEQRLGWDEEGFFTKKIYEHEKAHWSEEERKRMEGRMKEHHEWEEAMKGMTDEEKKAWKEKMKGKEEEDWKKDLKDMSEEEREQAEERKMKLAEEERREECARKRKNWSEEEQKEWEEKEALMAKQKEMERKKMEALKAKGDGSLFPCFEVVLEVVEKEEEHWRGGRHGRHHGGRRSSEESSSESSSEDDWHRRDRRGKHHDSSEERHGDRDSSEKDGHRGGRRGPPPPGKGPFEEERRREEEKGRDFEHEERLEDMALEEMAVMRHHGHFATFYNDSFTMEKQPMCSYSTCAEQGGWEAKKKIYCAMARWKRAWMERETFDCYYQPENKHAVLPWRPMRGEGGSLACMRMAPLALPVVFLVCLILFVVRRLQQRRRERAERMRSQQGAGYQVPVIAVVVDDAKVAQDAKEKEALGEMSDKAKEAFGDLTDKEIEAMTTGYEEPTAPPSYDVSTAHPTDVST